MRSEYLLNGPEIGAAEADNKLEEQEVKNLEKWEQNRKSNTLSTTISIP
jgi:hypothetical protein